MGSVQCIWKKAKQEDLFVRKRFNLMKLAEERVAIAEASRRKSWYRQACGKGPGLLNRSRRPRKGGKSP